MAEPKRVRFYLEDDLRKSAAAGQHNFIGKITGVLRAAGFEVGFHPNTTTERIKAAGRRGYGLCHMTPPPNARCLTFRRVYHYPFWQIQASDKRWEWDVAHASFDPGQCPRKEADRFYGFWRKRIGGALLDQVGDDGFVYIPLQGRLTEQRSFQSCSPLDMIRRTRAALPGRRLIVTLHPKETYTPGELAELEALEARDPALDVRMGERDALLPRCSFVVTQTSSIAFDGMFFGKPSVVFGQTDFHHVMVDGRDSDAFDRVTDHRPDYAAYLWWVWQHMAINAGHDSAEAKIRAKLSAAGWPVG
ncbi:hypothetical protein [uncultured Tateyamaria sp.]|uniref:hypothetical protein n=1 Tax=uncultured Tateyamaria sp. TaxID=455651 RepID=UPI0026356164|nr:hypothetical protein [uncultured Tateyamaria sp.]